MPVNVMSPAGVVRPGGIGGKSSVHDCPERQNPCLESGTPTISVTRAILVVPAWQIHMIIDEEGGAGLPGHVADGQARGIHGAPLFFLFPVLDDSDEQTVGRDVGQDVLLAGPGIDPAHRHGNHLRPARLDGLGHDRVGGELACAAKQAARQSSPSEDKCIVPIRPRPRRG